MLPTCALLFTAIFGATASPLPNISFSRDACTTTSPVYANADALSAAFIAAAGAASYQNFDTQNASATLPNVISFPTGSAYNGTMRVSAVNATLISQTCTRAPSCRPAAAVLQMKIRLQCS